MGAYTRADQPDVPVDDGHPPPLEDDPVPPGTPAPPPPSLDRSELTFLVLVASALGALAIAVIVVFAFCVANGLFGF
ncbi:MAG: hypothetical protein WBW47_07610 [Thermoplasmata archaeon]